MAVLTLVCAVGLAGCGGGQKAEDGHDHGHDHDHEHAAHVVPAHKPRTYPQAVQRLRTFQDQAGAVVRGGQAAALTRDESTAQAIDIASWLPEIAGDSDLPERSWNEVAAASSALLASYEVLAGRRAGDVRAAARESEQAVARLERVLAAADPRWFRDLASSGDVALTSEAGE
jgi:hypothetical protein